MPDPVVKWAGGKRQLLPYIHQWMPKRFRQYYEPFLGGGAVLFDLLPEKAHVSDSNEALIALYLAIRDDPAELMEILTECDQKLQKKHGLDEQKSFYYDIRSQYNACLFAKRYDVKTAAYLLFLNKHCFNGLYRINRQGGFNVPFAGSSRRSFDAANITEMSCYLQHVDLRCCDFERLCTGVQRGDFVFFDSPYAPLQEGSFTAYTKEGFPKEDHVRLAHVFRTLDRRGALCMLTNHDTPLIRKLYKGYSIRTVSVKRLINRDAKKRTGEEVIITNYG